MPTLDLSSLAHQVQELGDRQAIADLITRLGLMLDQKRFEGAESILTGDITVQTPGGSARGPQAVVAQARRNHAVRTQHVITDVLIDLAGDRAEVHANLTATFAPDSDQPTSRIAVSGSEQTAARVTVGQRYRFEAARGELGWLLARIEVTRVWSTEALPAGARITASADESSS